VSTNLNFTSINAGTVIFTLDHEQSDGSEENAFLDTDDWRFEEDSRRFPGDPSNTVGGGGFFLDTAPDEWQLEKRGVEVAMWASDPLKGPDNPSLNDQVVGPDGRTLQAVVSSPYVANGSNFYIRESFEPGHAQWGLGAPSGLKPLRAYNHAAMFRVDMGANDQWRDWPFFQISLRDRNKDVNHQAIFRGAKTATPDTGGTEFLDAAGNAVTPVGPFGPATAPIRYWGFWKANELFDKWQALTGDAPWLSQYGVQSVTREDGTAYPQFWYNHYATPVSGTATSGTGGTALEDTGKTFVTTGIVTEGDTVLPSSAISAVYSDGGQPPRNATKVVAIAEDTLTLDKSIDGIIGDGEAYDVRKTYQNPNGDTVEKVGVDGMNPLFRTCYHAPNDSTWDSSDTIIEAFFGGSSTVNQLMRDGRGAMIFDPVLRRQTAQIKAPGAFWEKKGKWWRPRGLAVEGATTAHTFTIT
jgi:hypothetical protein